MYTLESVRPDNSTQAGKSKAKKRTVDFMIKKKKAAAGSDVDEDKKAPRPIKVSAPKSVAPATDFFAPKSKKLGSNDEVSTASSKSKKVATKKENINSLKDATCIMVSHDSGFLRDCCTNIIQIQNLKLKQFKGNLDSL
jgi:hypothetical protein